MCNENSLFKRSERVRDNEFLNVFQCSSCGLISLSDFSHISNEFYESSTMRRGDAEQQIAEILEASKNDDERRFEYVKKKKELFKKEKVVLDYGCGAGGFLLNLSKLIDKSKLYGIEIEDMTRRFLNDSGIKVVKSVEEYKKNVGQKVDFVSMFHVLEHLPDPKKCLIELRSILTDTAKIFIEVPNADDALLSIYKCESFANFVFWSPHLYTFNIKSFEIMAKETGYSLKNIKQIQRYPISNHLYWLKEGKPNGHKMFDIFNYDRLSYEYEKVLRKNKICDTLMVEFEVQP